MHTRFHKIGAANVCPYLSRLIIIAGLKEPLPEEFFEVALSLKEARRQEMTARQFECEARSNISISHWHHAREELSKAFFAEADALADAEDILCLYGGRYAVEHAGRIAEELMSLPEGQYLNFLARRIGVEQGYKAWLCWRTTEDSLPSEFVPANRGGV